MNEIEKAIALIALAQQTYEEDYYGKDVVPLRKADTDPGTDSSGESTESTEG